MANKLSSKNAEQQSEASKFVDGVERMIDGTPRVVTRADNNPPSLVALLEEAIAETYALEFAKVDPIRAKANATDQKIETDEQLAAWTAIYTECRELQVALDTARKNEKRPFTECVDGAFEVYTAPLLKIMEFVRAAADNYNREKLRKQRAQEAADRAKREQEEAEARQKARELAEFGETDAAIEQVQRAAEIAQEAETSSAPARVADTTRVRAAGGGSASGASVWKFRIDDYSKVDLNALRMLIPRAAVEKAIAAIVKQQKGDTKIDGVTVYEDVGTTFRK